MKRSSAAAALKPFIFDSSFSKLPKQNKNKQTNNITQSPKSGKMISQSNFLLESFGYQIQPFEFPQMTKLSQYNSLATKINSRYFANFLPQIY